MAGGSTSTVKFMNPYPLKIDVVKFDGENNFGVWRSEVMDALTASNLKDTLWLDKKPEATSEQDWDKMNRTTCGLKMSYLTQTSSIMCYMNYLQGSCERSWRRYLTKSIESQLQLKRRLYCIQMKRELSIDEHMNNYTKFLTDLLTWMSGSMKRIGRWFYWILFLTKSLNLYPNFNQW